MSKLKNLFWLRFLGLLAACAPAAEEPPAVEATAVSQTVPTAAPTNTSLPPTTTPAAATVAEATADTPSTFTPVPTESPLVLPTATPETAVVMFGRTSEGAYFHGDPDAPVTIIDYSDFL